VARRSAAREGGLLDEARQAFPVTQAGGLRAKGLEVIVHDLVQRTLRGTPRHGDGRRD
jgi:hypothetical protein